MKFALITLVAFFCASILGAAETRVPIKDAHLSLSKAPSKQKNPVAIDAKGRFRVEEMKPGAWMLTVRISPDYVEKWIAAELGSRNWKTADAAVRQAKSMEEGGSHERTVVAIDKTGKLHNLSFKVITVVEDTDEFGEYVKAMRFHHLDKGQSFKFRAGKNSGGVIAGRVEGILNVD